MKETERLKLKLPEAADFYNVEDSNGNFKLLDEVTVIQEDFDEFKSDISETIESMEQITTEIDNKMDEFKEEFDDLKENVIQDTKEKFNELDAKLFNEIHGYIDCVTTRNEDGSITEVSSIGTIVTSRTETGYKEVLTKPNGDILTKTTTRDGDKILEVVT